MRGLVVLGAVLLSSQLSPVLSASGFLALKSGTAARRAATARLRAQAARLARALRWDLNVAPEALPQLIAVARDRVGEEIDRLPFAENPGAALLRGYSLQAPPAMLLYPADVGSSWPGAFAAAPEEQDMGSFARAASSESRETFVRSDGQGHSVTHTRRCKDGKCVERVEAKTMPTASVDPLPEEPVESMARQTEPLQGAVTDVAKEPLASAVQNMAREMWKIQRSIGRSGLEEVVHDIFRANSKPEAMGGLNGNEAMPDIFRANSEPEAMGGLNGDEVMRDIFRANSGPEAMGGLNGSEVQSVSSATQVVVDNGKLIKSTRECKNGHCVTKITKGDMGGQGSGDTTEPQAEEHVVPLVSMPL